MFKPDFISYCFNPSQSNLKQQTFSTTKYHTAHSKNFDKPGVLVPMSLHSRFTEDKQITKNKCLYDCMWLLCADNIWAFLDRTYKGKTSTSNTTKIYFVHDLYDNWVRNTNIGLGSFPQICMTNAKSKKISMCEDSQRHIRSN